MAMGAAYILLMVMVSMEALLLLVAAGAAGTSAAAVSGGTIRLPSDARAVPAGVAADLVRAMAMAKKLGDDEKRPWECCDNAICTLSYIEICWCFDHVERCSDNCKDCEEMEDSLYICKDSYRRDGGGAAGPKCHKHGNGRGALADPGKAAAVMPDNSRKKNAGGGGDDDEKRPWKCCDMTICAKSWPPICGCMDRVEQCASTCQFCEPVEDGPGYRCLDPYRGDPGPRCHEDDGGAGHHDWARRLARGYRF